MLAAASAIGTTLPQVDLTSVFCSGDIFDTSLFVRLEEDFAVPFFAVLPALVASVLVRLGPGSLDPRAPFAAADHAADLEFVFAEEALDPGFLGLAMLGVTAPFA